MSHLSPERLAALADEAPSVDEAAHLAVCAECARERDVALSLLALAAAERMRIDAPLTSWESLAPALDPAAPPATGLQAPGRNVLKFRAPSSRAMLQVAAGLLLVAFGAAAGRMSVGHPALPLTDDDAPAQHAAATTAALADTATPHFASAEEARQARALYELRYQQAAAFLASSDSSQGTATPAAMKTRLAALDRVGQTIREALHEAPYDPVINGYYLTTIGQREATLRQLNTALPAGVRLNSF